MFEGTFRLTRLIYKYNMPGSLCGLRQHYLDWYRYTLMKVYQSVSSRIMVLAWHNPCTCRNFFSTLPAIFKGTDFLPFLPRETVIYDFLFILLHTKLWKGVFQLEEKNLKSPPLGGYYFPEGDKSSLTVISLESLSVPLNPFMPKVPKKGKFANNVNPDQTPRSDQGLHCMN